jgi:lysophospholipase L1-like esterase
MKPTYMLSVVFAVLATILTERAWAGPDYGNIVLIGDSITQASSTQLSYRYRLWKRLIDDGATFNFVGSLNVNLSGNPVWPAYAGRSFDRDHEGHWGWRTDQILGQLSGWLAGYTPNIALIHLGTNDVVQSQSASSTIGELGQIIDRLRADNPRVKILLARILPTSGGAAVNARINELNALITGLVSSKNTALSPIRLVDQNSVHPNATGEEKMAQKWQLSLRALAGVLDTQPPAPPIGVTVRPAS